MHNILLYVNPDDDNQRALKSLEAIGDVKTSEIHVVSVAERLPIYTAFPSTQRFVELEKALSDAARSAIEAALGVLEEKGFRAFGKSLSGRFPETLIEYATQAKIDLIVKEPRHSLDSTFGLSKGDMKLMRECPVPMLLTRRALEKSAVVFAGLAVCPGDKGQNMFCRNVLQSAVSFCRKLSSKLHIGHVWSVLAKELLDNRLSDEELRHLLVATEEQHRATLAKEVEQVDCSGIQFTSQVEEGDHLQQLLKMIERVKPDLIVLGSVGRSGLRGYLLGNTTESILNRLDVPILLLKPESHPL